MERSRLVRAGLAVAAVAATAGVAAASARPAAGQATQEGATGKAVHEGVKKAKKAKDMATRKLAKAKPVSRAKREALRTAPTNTRSAAPVATPRAVPQGSAQEIAHQMVLDRGWSEADFQALVQLWNRESGWSTTAQAGSGAYGIPQALPGSKMGSAGDDWETNPATQIKWGLGYIAERYGTPSNAWATFQSQGWY